jgi:hypothetical protein
MKMRYFSPLLAVVLFATATAAQAAVHRVYPGGSIQNVIDDDNTLPGDTILVEPGVYKADPLSQYGLRISKDNLRLIGKVKKGQGEAGKVRLVYEGEFYEPDNKCLDPVEANRDPICKTGQRTGVFAAPAGCEFEMTEGECKEALELGAGEPIPYVKDFYIRGFSVEKFPRNGIQTRWVDGFEFVRNASVKNLNNGIYPTLSANGLVRNNEAYGSLDTSMWVAGSENVRVIGNDLYGSPIGLEVNVSLNIEVKHNDVHDNTVGIALFHPNSAGNPPRPVMGNWVVEHNNVYDNNLSPNPAPPGSFQADLPPGIGILVLGVSDNVVAKNTVENNDFVGIGMLGWCTSQFFQPAGCLGGEPALLGDPSANNNLVAQNKLNDNGMDPPLGYPLAPLASDIIYLQTPPVEPGTGNGCKKNKPKDVTFFSFPDGPPPPLGTGEPADELPTDGC